MAKKKVQFCMSCLKDHVGTTCPKTGKKTIPYGTRRDWDRLTRSANA